VLLIDRNLHSDGDGLNRWIGIAIIAFNLKIILLMMNHEIFNTLWFMANCVLLVLKANWIDWRVKLTCCEFKTHVSNAIHSDQFLFLCQLWYYVNQIMLGLAQIYSPANYSFKRCLLRSTCIPSSAQTLSELYFAGGDMGQNNALKNGGVPMTQFRRVAFPSLLDRHSQRS
jgi:hypothetical protein